MVLRLFECVGTPGSQQCILKSIVSEQLQKQSLELIGPVAEIQKVLLPRVSRCYNDVCEEHLGETVGSLTSEHSWLPVFD